MQRDSLKHPFRTVVRKRGPTFVASPWTHPHSAYAHSSGFLHRKWSLCRTLYRQRPRWSTRRWYMGSVGPNDHILPPRKQEKENPVSRREWEKLIIEFEQRAYESQHDTPNSSVAKSLSTSPTTPFRYKSPPTDRPTYRENPDRLVFLPLVETTMMAALTATLWFFGRVLQLDSFLMLLYPLPMIFAGMRWGPKQANHVLLLTLIEVLVTMGPLFVVTYYLNSGLLGWVFTQVLWRYWPWWGCLIAGAVAKTVGILGQFGVSSLLLRMNSWTLLTEETQKLLSGVGKFICNRLLNGRDFVPPSTAQIRIGMAGIIILYSVLHVLSSYLVTTMILDRLSYRLKKAPRLMPILQWAKEQSYTYHATQRDIGSRRGK